jgi:chaperonin GroEL
MHPAPGGDDRGRAAAQGVGVLAGLVARALGPAGRPPVVKDPTGGEIEAADAETIVARFSPDAPDDPGEALGASYVRDLVRDQRAAAPDGAATAVVLAGAMVRRAVEAVDGKADPTGLAWGIQAARDRVLDELGRRAADLSAKEEIAAVMAAAIFDRALADVLAEAFDKVGKDGVITVEPAGQPGLELGLSEGMGVDGGYVWPGFVTDAGRGEAVLCDPLVLIVDAEVTAAEDVLPVIGVAAAAGRPLVVLAAGVSGAALEALAASRTSGTGATLAAAVPGDRLTRESLLGDLAVVTGGRVTGGTGAGPATRLAGDDPSALGRAEKVVATRDRTLIVGGAADEAVLRGRVRRIQAEIESAKSAQERQQLFTRLARLAGGAATVRVGGATGAETARRVARAERGLQIARLAMEFPILPGGGAALADVQHALAKFPRSVPGGRSGDHAAGARIVLESLTAPMRQLAENAGVPTAAIEKALKSRKEGSGIDPATGRPAPTRPRAVDILPVVEAAVSNATALTVRFLTG